jgi:hypothetical protein
LNLMVSSVSVAFKSAARPFPALCLGHRLQLKERAGIPAFVFNPHTWSAELQEVED